MKRVIFAALAVLTILGIGCQARPLPLSPSGYTIQDVVDPMSDECIWTTAESVANGTYPCGTALVQPDENGTLGVGDSVTWPLTMNGVEPFPVYGAPGWTAGHVLPWLRDIAPEVKKLVIALVNNDAARGTGWNNEDVARWTELLSLVPDTVVILPYVDATAPSFRADIFPPAEFNEAIQWIISTGVKTISWEDYVTADTFGPDGTHLAQPGDTVWTTSPVAMATRSAALQAAAAR